ncbi:MAG: hypothetical protein R2864_05490 [Syntrophotaleaceae bacterium]
MEKRFREGKQAAAAAFWQQPLQLGKNLSAYLFKDGDRHTAYYDEQGKSLRKAFLKAPLHPSGHFPTSTPAPLPSHHQDLEGPSGYRLTQPRPALPSRLSAMALSTKSAAPNTTATSSNCAMLTAWKAFTCT